MTSKASGCWVVYSPNESAISDRAGFWSNKFGSVTRFSTEETGRLQLPISTGRNARFAPSAQRYCG
ncbi:TPA: hypothetical protein SMO43_001299 [Pseudomonas aeruginosa]|nr:hypothetical protein [Pseudomonas aeruginosa]HEK0165588.1 hypothetical protein [Pseudomonas aeruginosa]